MSDCSTNAFKVPACSEPKTCGNCALHDVCNPAIETPCVGWREDAQSIEQRYKRLAQVAREMYQALVFCTGGCMEGCPMLNDGCDVDTGILKVQLEALGVSLDD